MVVVFLFLLFLIGCGSENDKVRIIDVRYYPKVVQAEHKILDKFTRTKSLYEDKEIDGETQNVYVGEQVDYYFEIETPTNDVIEKKINRKLFKSLDVGGKVTQDTKPKIVVDYEVVEPDENSSRTLDERYELKLNKELEDSKIAKLMELKNKSTTVIYKDILDIIYKKEDST